MVRLLGMLLRAGMLLLHFVRQHGHLLWQVLIGCTLCMKLSRQHPSLDAGGPS
jgi:hypothetical protein